MFRKAIGTVKYFMQLYKIIGGGGGNIVIITQFCLTVGQSCHEFLGWEYLLCRIAAEFAIQKKFFTKWTSLFIISCYMPTKLPTRNVINYSLLSQYFGERTRNCHMLTLAQNKVETDKISIESTDTNDFWKLKATVMVMTTRKRGGGMVPPSPEI